MRKPFSSAACLLIAGATLVGVPDDAQLYDPYARPKNGPPLTNLFHKTEPWWILGKLTNPRSHPSARMPEFSFSEEEALDAMAYLKSIADPQAPSMEWPAWAAKSEEEMSEDELVEMLDASERGKAVWGNARCTICHKVNGPGGALIGGFVDLRVGGIDLQAAGAKFRARRDWLYRWIEDPKSHFPDTLMPRYRLSDEDRRALVEFILRDDGFRPAEPPAEGDAARWKVLDDPERVARGRHLIELSRCVVCHDVRGIPEVLTPSERPAAPRPGTMEWIAYDIRCLACHSLGARGGSYAPDLSSEGSRLRREWIEEFVQRPDLVRPLSQQMPKFHLSPEEGRVVAEHMATRRLDPLVPADPPPGDPQAGRALFAAKGCVACHTTGEGPGGSVGPSLDTVGDRLLPGYLLFHVKNPHAVNPFSAEPDYGLSDDEAASLAAYLGSKRKK